MIVFVTIPTEHYTLKTKAKNSRLVSKLTAHIKSGKIFFVQK